MEVTSTHKILYVITKAYWGGAQKYVFDCAVAALARGYEVTVACGGTGEMVTRLEAAHIPVLSAPSMARDVHLGDDARAFRELAQIMRTVRPEVVHTNSSKAGALAALAARVSGVRRVVFTAHGWAFYEDRPLWKKALIGLSQYVTVLLSDETICVSEKVRTDAWWMLGVQRRLHTVHNGVHPIALLPRDEARAQLAPGARESFWIGTIAELHPRKQLETAITAFARIADRFPDTKLVVLGEGQERTKYENLIREFNLETRVLLCGHVEHAPMYLGAFDVFVSSSMAEGFAYVLLEAGICGLPIVATPVGGTPEIITNDVTGLLVPTGDVAGFAIAFEKVISDEPLRTRLGAAVRARTEKEFSVQHMAEETFALYD